MRDDGGELGELSTLAADDPLGGTPEERAAGDLVLEAQRARVFGALFTKPVLRRFGRYVVLDVLGQGGMGVVLKGYDDTLDRQVAIKVLHRELDEQHTTRLRREAQALARLSHPNVVQVYEVGQLDGQTFVAMELCKGQTLRAWMQQEPRPGWKACVALFLQLGQGLAAAHERGLVHRDFKPGNAIVDEEGRARVLDFGLARRVREDGRTGAIEPAPTDARVAVPLETSLTRTGAVLGTPAYMPPEQMSGLVADARSDQFSFCVALHEAVYGERPYEGDSMMALMVSMRSGVVRPAPRGTDVPVALRKVLLRGLAVEPVERWPSMAALLEALGRIANPRRWRWAALGVTVGLLALGGGLSTTRALEWMSRCTGARAQLEGVWDDGRRRAVKEAILGTGLSYAGGTWERVEPRLDEYAEAWATEHTDACEATQARHEQSEQDMSLRMGCLHERWQHLRATVNELGQADATVVENAVEAVARLPGLERCRDLQALRAEVPPPEDPEVAAKVAALDERLMQAKVLEALGKYEDGLRLADAVVVEGEALDYEPLMARAWLRQGSLREDTGSYEGALQALRLAYAAALAHGMEAEAADVAVQLVFILGSRLTRHTEGRVWAEQAEPLSRAVGTDEARARHLATLGSVAVSQGEYEQARGFHERALAIREKALGPHHIAVAVSLNNLGNAAYGQGEYEQARELHARALVIKEEALGSDHPDVAHSLNNLGNVAVARAEYEEAQELHARALAILEKALGPDHPEVATSFHNLGNVADFQGKHEQARKAYERALAILETTLGPEHPEVATSLINLGLVALAQGRDAEARATLERALGILERALGPEHPLTAYALGNLGSVAYAQGLYEEARGFSERAVAIFEKAHGVDHPTVTNPLTGLGVSLLALARPADALVPLERALTLCTTQDVDPALLGETRFALTRALWDAPATQGRDRLRAHTLAAQARDVYATLGDAHETELAEVQAWLGEHGVP